VSTTNTATGWVGYKKAPQSNDNDCVEVHHTLRKIRDSKDPNKKAVKGDVVALVAAVRAGIV
jgi:hypothetical protein